MTTINFSDAKNKAEFLLSIFRDFEHALTVINAAIAAEGYTDALKVEIEALKKSRAEAEVALHAAERARDEGVAQSKKALDAATVDHRQKTDELTSALDAKRHEVEEASSFLSETWAKIEASHKARLKELSNEEAAVVSRLDAAKEALRKITGQAEAALS